MKLSIASFTLATLLSVQSIAADGPCKPKGEAQHNARKALHDCLEGWAKGKDSVPSDDCSAKLTAFVSAAKDRIACHTEHKKK